MSTHKHINKICCAVLALALVITLLFMNGEKLGISKMNRSFDYESRLFDTSKVHTINIVMDNWKDFISTCTNEKYAACSVIIDNKAYKNVAIRAKGNTSLTQVQSYGNDRYSFKIEFDHYDSTTSYYGLDKLSLNNIIQDNTYMKDFLSYQMMREAGADAPLCSYVQVLVNGEEWGLYLAVEGVEDSFLQRNYGNDYGELYKPDSMSMGGGVGNGGKFDMDDWREENGQSDTASGDRKQNNTNTENTQPLTQQTPQKPDESSQTPSGEVSQKRERPNGGGMDGSRGSKDVSLIYTDDKYDSYSNIFENAKTDITKKDKDRLIASLKQLNENSNIENVVDVEAVIRYFVAHNFTCNDDSYTGSMIHNYYLYEKDGKLSMLPWDYNLAFGGFQGGSNATNLVNNPIDSPVSGGTIESRPMLSWIFKSKEYTELYHKYFAEFIENYFTSGKFDTEIDAVKAMISPYVQSDPTKFCTYEEFETGIDTLKEFCLLRYESINGQLNGTIPSTSDGQSKDDSAFVDASKIKISDMGSMHGDGNMGGGMKPANPNGDETDNNSDNQIGNNDSNQSGKNNTFSPFQGENPNGGTPPEMPDGSQGGNRPQMPNSGGIGDNQGNMQQRPSGDQDGQFQRNFDRGQNAGSPPQMPSGNQNEGEPPQMPSGEENGDGGFGQFEERQNNGEKRPNMQGKQRPNDTQSSANGVIAITVTSVIVLIGGLAFAFLYKRKGY